MGKCVILGTVIHDAVASPGDYENAATYFHTNPPKPTFLCG
jgi:hypothetical protein